MELNTKLTLMDKFCNLFTKKASKVKGYCGNCNRPVFSLESKWAKKGLCIYCNDMTPEESNGNTTQ
jgi:hypothetical protein